MVLALSVDVGLCSLLPPNPSELRMKGEAGFIFKEHYPFTVAFSGEKEFFLPLLEIRLHPPRWPEYIGTSVGAENSPVSLSCVGRVAPGLSRNGIFSSTRRPQRRPIESWINRNLEATSTMPHQAPSVPFRRIGMVCRGEDDPRWLQVPPDTAIF